MTIVIIGLLGLVALGAALYKFYSTRQRQPKESPTLGLQPLASGFSPLKCCTQPLAELPGTPP